MTTTGHPTAGSEPFTGKAALVTGAGSGIGRAIARAFAAQGASVVAAGIDQETVQETAALIERGGGRARAVVCDVADDDSVAAAVATAVERFGGLHLPVNSAGVEQPVTPLAEISVDDWNRIIDVDVSGTFLLMRHEIAAMTDAGGSIVNISSGAGVIGIRGQAAYVAAKHGVLGLTKSAALDYADQGMRINAICPGIVSTPMMDRFAAGPEGRARVLAQEPIGRMGAPEEIASAALWLCSDLAAFTIGHALVVDGGQTIGL